MTLLLVLSIYWVLVAVGVYIYRHANHKQQLLNNVLNSFGGTSEQFPQNHSDKSTRNNSYNTPASLWWRIVGHLISFLLAPIALPFVGIHYLVKGCRKLIEKVIYNNRPKPLSKEKLKEDWIKKDSVYDDNGKIVSLAEYNTKHGTAFTLGDVYGTGYLSSLTDDEKISIGELQILRFQDNLDKDQYYNCATIFGNALLDGDFSKLSQILGNDASTIVYALTTILGRDNSLDYWKDWREKNVVSKKVHEFEVCHSNYYYHACLRLDAMVVLFWIKDNLVQKITLAPQKLSKDLDVPFRDDLLYNFPYKYDYIKRRVQPLRESKQNGEPIKIENRLHCMSCGTASESLEWHSVFFNSYNNGYQSHVSICPHCKKVVEQYPEYLQHIHEPKMEECDLLESYANCWNRKEIGWLFLCLSDNFRYSSMWVFEELDKEDYLKYFESKLENIKRTGSNVHAKVVNDLIVVTQDGKNVVIVVKIENGKIVRADMTAPEFYGIPSESKEPAAKKGIYGRTALYNEDCLKETKFVENLPTDIVIDERERYQTNSSDLGPCSVRQVAEDSNWILISHLQKHEPELYEKIKACFRTAVENGLSEAANGLGIFEYNFEENFDEGLRLFKLAASAGSHGAMINVFSVLWNNKEYKKAVEWLNEVFLKESPSVMCLYNLAFLYYQGENYPNNPLTQDIEKTHALLERIIDIDETNLEKDELGVVSASRFFLSDISQSSTFSNKGIAYHRVLCYSACKTTEIKDKGELFYTLEMLHLDNGWKLGINLPKEDVNRYIGGESSFYVYDEQGQESKDIIDHITVIPSKMGAWQVYLLLTSETVMPAYFPAAQESRRFLFKNSDLESIDETSSLDVSGLVKHDLITPKVIELPSTTSNEYIADIYCTYWNEYCGLMREHARVTINQNRITSFEKIGEIGLCPYNLGILF